MQLSQCHGEGTQRIGCGHCHLVKSHWLGRHVEEKWPGPPVGGLCGHVPGAVSRLARYEDIKLFDGGKMGQSYLDPHIKG